MTSEVNTSGFGFPVFDLSGATAAGGELSPLRFDRSKYLDYEQFLAHLHSLPVRKTCVKKSDLSVNGRVVADRMERYLSARGENSSALKQALITPRHYMIYKDPRLAHEADHFVLGTFCHAAFLEPKLFEKVRIEPKENEASIAGLSNLIRWYWEQLGMAEEYVLSDANRDTLKTHLYALRKRFRDEGYRCVREEHNTIIDIIRKTYKTYGGGILPRLLKLADTETSFYTTDPGTGLDVKVRPDAMLLEENVGANIVVSLKTTRQPTIEAFARDAVRLGYDLSEGMYLDVVSHTTGRQFAGTLMIVLQTVQPWQVYALWWSPEDLEAGKYKYRQALEIVAECKGKRHFPGFDARAEEGAQGIIRFELPAYSRLALPDQYIEEIPEGNEQSNPQ